MRPESAPDPTQNPPQTPAGKAPKKPWEPPRGIRYVHRPDRPSPFYLVWTEDGQERKQSFKDEKLREQVAKALAEKRARHGSSILTFDPDQWRTWERFREIIGEDTDPLQVAREWMEARGTTKPTLTVAQAVNDFLALRDSEGGVDPRYLAHMRAYLQKRFAVALGHVLLCDLDAQMIRDWLVTLKDRDNLGVLSRQHHYRSVTAFLNRCVTEQWIAHSPCDIVVIPQPTRTEIAQFDRVKLLPVDDAVKLFRANRDERCVGRLALEAFGGIRYTTAGLMTRDLLDFERKAITMPGAIHKSRKRKYRQGHPECLWAWLRHAPESCWTMTPKEYTLEKRDSFIRAGVTNPGNSLRHSFASYLLAHTKDLPRVSYLMQHAKTTMTERYEGRADEESAKRYLEITPNSVK